jgi:hypothetical protein
MIKRFASLIIRRIVGRIKRMNQTTLRIGVAGFSIPLGFTLLVYFRGDWGMFSVAIGFLVIGMLSWLWAIKAAEKADKNEAVKYKEQKELLEGTLNELISEMKGLREDLTNRGVNDGKPNKPKPKM